MKRYDDYPIKSYDKLRYSDADMQGHINNATFATFFETGRTELLYLKDKLTDEDAMFVLAQSNIALKGEIFWPGTVEIGTCVQKIGNSSITLSQSLFQNEKLVASAETVIVQINKKSKKAQALNAFARETFESYKMDKS